MVTRQFHCSGCDSYETLSIWPDCCLWCGGSVSPVQPEPEPDHQPPYDLMETAYADACEVGHG
jgi:hypothetical protein